MAAASCCGRTERLGLCVTRVRWRPSVGEVIPMRGKHVVDKLSRGLSKAEGKRPGTRKLSGN